MMKRRYGVYAGIISVLVILFFLFSSLCRDEANGFTGRVHGDIETSQTMDDMHSAVADTEGIRLEQEAALRIRCVGKAFQSFSMILFLLGLILGKRMLFFSEKGCFFAYYRSSMFCLAHFLCEIFIRQKKDGKKRFFGQGILNPAW